MIAAHFTFEECTAYFNAESTGGNRAAQELYAKFGVKRIQADVSPEEVAIMAKNRKVIEAKDYKGLTFRGDGYGPLVLQEPEFQASGVMLASGDVYTALQTGVIDACEIGNAFGNYALGIQEITKYWTFPGMQQLCQNHSKIFNLDLWNKMPAELQRIIELVCVQHATRSWAFSWTESAKIIPVLKDKWGVEINRLSPECQRTWKEVGWRLADNYSKKDPAFGDMWKSMKGFMDLMQPYEELTKVTYPGSK